MEHDSVGDDGGATCCSSRNPRSDFLLQSVLAQVEQDGIDTATIRGRDNKAAFEQTMARVHRLVAMLLRDAEVQDAIRWAEKQEAERFAKQQKIDDELNRLYEQRGAIEAKRLVLSYPQAAKLLYMGRQTKIPPWGWLALIPVVAFSVFMVIPFIAICTAVAYLTHIHRKELLEQTNGPLDYQLSVIDKRIAAVHAETE